ncbi:MAG: hypothetical protein ACOCXG_05230 [Nanoarchaeota archaeon]
MKERVRITKNSNFYKDFRETNPALVLGLIIISLGFYVIDWIFLRNKEFEEIDKHAPDSKRGAILLMIIPFMWFFIMIVLKHIIFSPKSPFLGIVEISGWLLIIFLILKYLYDFCISFGFITKTNGAIWFLFFLPIVPAGIGALLGYPIFLILLFLPAIVIPAMQAELNTTFNKITIKKKYDIFYN